MELDQEIYDQIMECTSARFGVKRAEINGYFNYPYPQRLFIMRQALKEYVLREAGDYRLFLKLTPEIRRLSTYEGDAHEAFRFLMCGWLDEGISAMEDSDYPCGDMVLSTLLWGRRYVERADKFLFRSWLSESNVRELKGKVCFIHTDSASRMLIKESESVRKLEKKGLKFVYRIIPDEMIEILGRVEDARYWMLGCSAALSLSYCRHIGAAFHWVIPDGVYSEKYFQTLAKLAQNHPVILQTSFRTDETVLEPLLAQYDAEGALRIPARDLVAHSLNALHLSAFHRMVNNRTKEFGYPDSHVLLWESPDTLHISAPHLDAKYLSAEFVATLPDRYFASFDSELDFFVKGEEFYITQADDDLFSNEMSMQEKYAMFDSYVPMMQYAQGFWGKIQYRDLLKFFNRGMVIRFNPDIRKSPKAMMPAQIDMEKALLGNALLATNPFKEYKLTQAA